MFPQTRKFSFSIPSRKTRLRHFKKRNIGLSVLPLVVLFKPVDFALKRGTFSKVGIGLEYGERGSWAKDMVRERYFNFTVALSLFGNDYWFVRPKYN